MLIKLSFILLTLISNLSAAYYGGSDNKNEKAEKIFMIDDYIRHFENSSQYNYVIGKCSQESNTPFLHNDLNSCATYSFKSTKAANKIYKRFKFSVFEYTNKELAEINFKSLLSSSHPDMGLTYSWDFVILIDAKLYWLNAGCIFSNEAWEIIKNAFKDSMHNNNEEDNSLKSFNCRCGSGCKP